MTNETLLDLDSILDVDLGSVEDVPDYVIPPEGNYVLTCKEAKVDTYKDKETKVDIPRIKVTMQVDETIELANEKELPVANNSLFTLTFQASQDGLKYFKKFAMKVLNVDDMNDATVRQAMDALENYQFKAAITIRKSESNGKTHENVNVRPVHES